MKVSRWIVLSLLWLPAQVGPFPLDPPVDCPQNYAPVICSDGVVYDNSCYAASYGATGCVPWPMDV